MGTCNSNSKSGDGAAGKSFSKMSESQRVTAIANALNNKSPDDMLEDVIYRLSGNEKPLTASDDDILATGSEIIYKTLTPRYDKKAGKRLTADELAKRLYNGENIERPSKYKHYVSNYFSTDYELGSWGQRNLIVAGILNKNAKVIPSNKIGYQATMEIINGTKLGKILKGLPPEGQESICALAKGYNVISDSNNGDKYILNHKALTLSKNLTISKG
jgi:hypothetical protein